MQSQDLPDTMKLMKNIILTFWSYTIILIDCESSEYATDQFNNINIYHQWDWYTFPVSIQRILPTIINGNQKPVVLQGFGNILCNRETFKNVMIFFEIFNLK